MNKGASPRIAVVAGLRTPFLKQGTGFAGLSARFLGAQVVRELVVRSGVDPARVERLVYGQVIASPEAPNIAREVVLGAGLSPQLDAFSISRACATGYQTTLSLAQAMQTGELDCGIAGGADCASDVPIMLSKPLSRALSRAGRALRVLDRVAAFRGLSVRDLAPVPPALREPSSRYTMGQAAEKMAQENGIPRVEQDALAHQSHVKAVEAWEQGGFDEQVASVYVPPRFVAVERDNLVREDSSEGGYRRLKPVFDRQHGTITAGNSSPLTDGASALLLVREDGLSGLGVEPLGYLRAHAFAALDPDGQMLMGPAYATPVALERAGLSLAEMDLVDMHEAFAAQVLSNLRAFASREWAQQHLGRDQAIGEVDPERFNVSGGSIALGHPFAATGARQILQALHDLRRRGGQFALCTACAAGGLGAAVVLEAAP